MTAKSQSELNQQPMQAATHAVLNIGRYFGILAEIPVFYPKLYDKDKILLDIILDRYIVTWPIYQLISEMKLSDISSRDAFEELL